LNSLWLRNYDVGVCGVYYFKQFSINFLFPIVKNSNLLLNSQEYPFGTEELITLAPFFFASSIAGIKSASPENKIKFSEFLSIAFSTKSIAS